ncbi:MAG: hypothetical protein L3J97_04400 [Thermoplasmata archaeon]|nr:hypothetical protein [Thermoplasmata archaeon]
MPSVLVSRYAVYFRLDGGKKVRRTIGRYPSLLVAIEGCFGTYRATGHQDYAIEDQRRGCEFLINRDLLLRLLFLKRHDQARYFDILNLLDRQGDQEELVLLLRTHAPI